MQVTQLIHPKGWHGLRNVWSKLPEVDASICLNEEFVRIELSDGRRHSISRLQLVSEDVAISSAVQWARRQGAGSLTVEW